MGGDRTFKFEWIDKSMNETEYNELGIQNNTRITWANGFAHLF